MTCNNAKGGCALSQGSIRPSTAVRVMGACIWVSVDATCYSIVVVDDVRDYLSRVRVDLISRHRVPTRIVDRSLDRPWPCVDQVFELMPGSASARVGASLHFAQCASAAVDHAIAVDRPHCDFRRALRGSRIPSSASSVSSHHHLRNYFDDDDTRHHR